MHSVLFVEDDPNIAKSVLFNFEQEGLSCVWAKSLHEARHAYALQPAQICLLDIGLPDGNGIDFCRELRKTQKTLPIIFLTAEQDENLLIKAFEVGATDYIRKPFSNRELIARTKANLERVGYRPTSSVIEFHGLSMDKEARLSSYQQKSLDLNRRQFDILFYLISNSERVVTREALLNFLGNELDVFERTIDVHLSQLRKKFKSDNVAVQISSIYGVGYRLEVLE